MKFRKSSSILIGAMLLSAISCGQYGMNEFSTLNRNMAPQYAPEDGFPIPEEDTQTAGHFKAGLSTLNGHVEGNRTVGDAKFSIREGKLFVEVSVHGSPVDITHIQHLHSGSKCPDSEADANDDGFIDIQEGMSSFGQDLLKLDSDLTNQLDGTDTFPTADGMGSYLYSQSAELDEVLTEGQLELEGKTIVVHGISEDINLPDTVEGLEGMPVHRSLPIACGVIKMATDTGGK